MKEERREMFARSHDVPRSRLATGRARTFVTLSPATTFFTSAVSINGPALTRFVLSSMVARAGGAGAALSVWFGRRRSQRVPTETRAGVLVSSFDPFHPETCRVKTRIQV